MEWYAIQNSIENKVEITTALLEQHVNPAAEITLFKHKETAIEVAKGLVKEAEDTQFPIYNITLEGEQPRHRDKRPVTLQNGITMGGHLKGHIYKIIPSERKSTKFELVECFFPDDPKTVFNFQNQAPAKPVRNTTLKVVPAKKLTTHQKEVQDKKEQAQEIAQAAKSARDLKKSPKKAQNDESELKKSDNPKNKQPLKPKKRKAKNKLRDVDIDAHYSFLTKVSLGALALGLTVAGGVWALGAFSITAALGFGALLAGATGLMGYLYDSWYSPESHDYCQSSTEKSVSLLGSKLQSTSAKKMDFTDNGLYATYLQYRSIKPNQKLAEVIDFADRLNLKAKSKITLSR